MKVKFNLYERVKVADLLPEKGGLEKATVATDIKRKLEITQKDIKRYEIKTHRMPDGHTATQWNEKGKEEIVFDMTMLEINMLKEGVEALSKKNEIPSEIAFIDFCNKIKGFQFLEKKNKKKK